MVAGALAKGWQPFVDTLTSADLLSAVRLTLLMALIAVPANSIFGLAAATAIARHKFPGKALLLSVIDLPFSISPVVHGSGGDSSAGRGGLGSGRGGAHPRCHQLAGVQEGDLELIRSDRLKARSARHRDASQPRHLRGPAV